MTAVTDAKSGVTAFTYDANGNLLSLTDARGSTTSYTYDSMDRVVTRTDPLGHSESFGYDPAGNLGQHTDRKGQVATFSYDALNRRTGTTYADATVLYSLDAMGRLTQVTDSVGGTITNTYDGLDRLTSQTTALGMVAYTYDVLGRRAQMTVPGQNPVAYAYDAASRLTSITQGNSVVQFTYDVANRRTSLTLPNGVSTQYAYDAASQLTALTYRLGITTLGDLHYTYDAGGNRIQVDGTWARTGWPPAVPSATYNANNQQLSFAGQSLTYDLNGNLTSDGTNTYAWDARNRLLAVTGPIPVSFVYDAAARRSRKTINGVTTDFLYDALNPVQEQSGSTVTNLLTGLGVDEYFSRADSASTVFLVSDLLGSTIALADSSGSIPTAYTYDPFGATSPAGASASNPFDFTAREGDLAALKYYRARYYHTGLIRFLSEDPLEFAGGDSNLYVYARNAPTQWTDPLGLQAVPMPAPLPLPVPFPPVFIPGTPENQRFVETTLELLQSLMGRRQRESGLENLSDDEIRRRARDKSLPVEERRRYAREEKYRDLRNKGKDRGGPARPMGFMPHEPVTPWDASELDIPASLAGRKK